MTDNKIRLMRTKLNMSQADLAENLPKDVDRIAVSFIESGRVLPNTETMRKRFPWYERFNDVD